MGIDLYCGDETFGCSYGSWNNVRNALIEATFEYLEVHFAVTDYEEGTHEYGSMIALKQYIKKILNSNKNEELIENFIVYSRLLEFVDLLIQFSVGGLYALCNKSDCEGFYSVGNSYDICELLKLVKPFLLKNKEDLNADENWIYNCIDNLTNIFNESVEKKEVVRIS
jgi:hypothetical protein